MTFSMVSSVDDVTFDRNKVLQVMKSGLCKFDDVAKLRACVLASKEDPTVLDDPVELTLEELVEKEEKRKEQLRLDIHFSGFSLAPQEMMRAYVAVRDECQGDEENVQANDLFTDAAAPLFRHMCNFVA